MTNEQAVVSSLSHLRDRFPTHPEALHLVPMAFAELDDQVLARATPLSRSNRDSKLQHRIRELLKGE